MKYLLFDGTEADLPFLPNTIAAQLMPRQDSPLAATLAPISTVAESRGMDGGVNAQTRFIRLKHYYVVPQVGYQFAVSASDVVLPGESSSSAAFQLGNVVEIKSTRTIVPVVAAFWGQPPRGRIVKVHEFWRLQPTRVLGEVDPAALPGWLETKEGSRFRIMPRVDTRLFVIQELTRRGTRVVPYTFLPREFTSLISVTGEVLERFEVSPT